MPAGRCSGVGRDRKALQLRVPVINAETTLVLPLVLTGRCGARDADTDCWRYCRGNGPIKMDSLMDLPLAADSVAVQVEVVRVGAPDADRSVGVRGSVA